MSSNSVSSIAFLQTDAANGLHYPEFIQALLEKIDAGSSILYDLTFQASFAKKLFDILKREGPKVQGYDRMKQTLAESMQKVMQLLKTIESDYGIALSSVLTPSTMYQLTADLSLVKEWMNEQEVARPQ